MKALPFPLSSLFPILEVFLIKPIKRLTTASVKILALHPEPPIIISDFRISNIQ